MQVIYKDKINFTLRFSVSSQLAHPAAAWTTDCSRLPPLWFHLQKEKNPFSNFCFHTKTTVECIGYCNVYLGCCSPRTGCLGQLRVCVRCLSSCPAVVTESPACAPLTQSITLLSITTILIPGLLNDKIIKSLQTHSLRC